MPLKGPGGLPPRALPAPSTPPAPKGLTGGRPEISAPKDPVQLAPGPNQLAGVLDHAPARLKAEMLHLQNRPGAFHEGAQPTRIIHGKEVTISAPILGMKVPKEGVKPGGPGGSGALMKKESSAPGRSALAGPEQLALEAPPPKAHAKETVEALPSLSLLPHKEAGKEGAAEIPLKPTGGEVALRPPSGPPAKPTAPAQPAPEGQAPSQPLPAPPQALPLPAPPALPHAQAQGPARPQLASGTQGPAAPRKPAQHLGEGNLPDTQAGPEDGKKKMGWGKKALIGVAALIGLSFLLPQDSPSSSPPDPDGKGA